MWAAASLTKPFQAAEPRLGALRVRFSFAGSQTIVTQLVQGARADVVATADPSSMADLVAAGLVEAPQVFTTNGLVVAVARGNPKSIAALADLARPDVRVVLADPSVPVGRYARQLLERAGLRVEAKSLELDTKATLGRVEVGDADAAVVYGTDVKASTRSEAVTVPEAAGLVARYPIAVLRASNHRREAAAFVESARSGVVHEELLAAGFLS